MKRWFSLILAGCMLMQLTLGSSSGYMKAETESEGPAEVSDEVQVQNRNSRYRMLRRKKRRHRIKKMKNHEQLP